MMYTIDAASLAGILGTWADGSDPLNEQLAAALGRAIERGDLAPGARLPSERDLGAQLGLSRTTIVAAYDRLRDRGLVRSRQGSGTRVTTRTLDSGRPSFPSGPGLIQPWLALPASSAGGAAEVGVRVGAGSAAGGSVVSGQAQGDPRPVPASADVVAMTIGALPGTARVAAAIRETVAADLDELLVDHGYLPFGLPALRAAVAAHMGRLGVPTTPDQVLVTTGAQQAVSLLADQLAGPQGLVAIENPTYIGAVDALRAVGTRMVPVPVGPAGMRLDVLRQVVASVTPTFVYLVPTHHNPTGVTMPDAARRELVRLAEERGLLLVEDLTPAPGLGDGGRPRPIAAYGGRDRVVTVGSLSKAGWGGLRLGWIRAERPLITRLAARKTVLDHGTSTLTQAVGARILPDIDVHEAAAEQEAARRRVVVEAALRELLPGWSWTSPAGGLSLWVRIPVGDAVAFSRLAADHGVLVRPGTVASPDGGFHDHLRIAVGEPPERLRLGVERLATAWAAYAPSAERAGSSLSISV